jgi:hypothetical protein
MSSLHDHFGDMRRVVCIIEILNVILVDIDIGEYSSDEDHYTMLLPQRTHKLTDTKMKFVVDLMLMDKD